MSADNLGSSPKFKSYATAGALGADVDVTLAAQLGSYGRGFRVGVAGDVVVMFPDGTQDTVYSVQVGERIDCRVWKLIFTGTVAQKITVFK